MSPFLSSRPPARETGPELLVLARWETFTAWLLAHTGRWPKTARFTLVQRLQNHALDVAEHLVVARYEPSRRRAVLHEANLLLERMRLLLRLARENGVQSRSGFESAARGLDEVGRMLHGWRRSLG
ncbi:MAG: four helix bundle protein [bacterium]|nr:four helix bundle protein [bacterium]